jgi:hypothetical protein
LYKRDRSRRKEVTERRPQNFRHSNFFLNLH